MATYFTDWANGNDNITAITGATFTESTKNLNKVGAFANYTANMRINIDGGTAVIDAIYLVASVTDNDNVVISATITSDASDPTDVSVAASAGTSEGAAWATINHAMNQVAAGDKVWVQGGTSYEEEVTMTTAGTTTNGITFEGYTSSTGDGGLATLDGDPGTLTNGITTTLGHSYYRLENLIIQGYSNMGFNSTTSDRLGVFNCQFNTNGARGFDCDNQNLFFECTATGNSGDGFGFDTNCIYVNCKAMSNGDNGFEADEGGGTLYNCVSFNNSDKQVRITGSSSLAHQALINCTLDGDDQSGGGIFAAAWNTHALINCIVYDCITGFQLPASETNVAHLGLNNLFNANTTDYVNWAATATDITDAPGFTDEANNDYTLAAGSAARNAGHDHSGASSPGMDIGAHQSADAGGTTFSDGTGMSLGMTRI